MARYKVLVKGRYMCRFDGYRDSPENQAKSAIKQIVKKRYGVNVEDIEVIKEK